MQIVTKNIAYTRLSKIIFYVSHFRVFYISSFTEVSLGTSVKMNRKQETSISDSSNTEHAAGRASVSNNTQIGRVVKSKNQCFSKGHIIIFYVKLSLNYVLFLSSLYLYATICENRSY